MVVATRGMVWQGKARSGKARAVLSWWRFPRMVLARQGEVWRGRAWRGQAWQGMARALLSWWWFREWLWLGAARLGEARRGLAGFGEDTFFWRMT